MGFQDLAFLSSGASLRITFLKYCDEGLGRAEQLMSYSRGWG